MSSLKRWRAIGGGGEFHKWAEAGESLEGTWRGLQDGQYGPVGTLETPEGPVRFAVTTALVERLQGIPEGTELRLEYLGFRRSKAGREYKDFAVWVATADEGEPSGEAAPF
ncbi:MAG TPA: hypothetical protein VLA62_08870 [Solirubrobacterales bacterium]|nr:hypothetical protein [Solirubrobacterales bacterium]